MATHVISIKTFKQIVPMLPVSISIMLKGVHGIGKSSLFRQLASQIRKELKKNPETSHYTFPLIDRRLSQMSEGDMIGLPSTEGEVTRFNPPDWIKRACTEPCFLLLDELNRASPEVMQAAFQIVLDRELNGWKLHPLTRVATAVNASAAYNVNEIDPALLDRFWAVELNATKEDFLEWGASSPDEEDELHRGLSTNIDQAVLDFISKHDEWLYPSKVSSPGDVEPSPRSWDMLSLSCSKLFHDPDNEDIFGICGGFVGREAAIAFKKFLKSDVRLTGKDLVENFAKVRGKIEKLGPEAMNQAIDMITKYTTEEIPGKLTETQSKNLREFMLLLGGEHRIAFWSKMIEHGVERVDFARSFHSAVGDLILKIFDVPFGEAGIGVIPKIPGMFKKETEGETEQ